MRYSAPVAIVATSLAAGLTVVAVRALGPGVEAHPFTRITATHFGWIEYAALSIVVLGVGIRIIAVLPYAEWGVRAIAVVKIADATRDAWLVALHPAVRFDVTVEVLPAFGAIAAAAVIALLIVRVPSPSRPRVDPEVAV